MKHISRWPLLLRLRHLGEVLVERTSFGVCTIAVFLTAAAADAAWVISVISPT